MVVESQHVCDRFCPTKEPKCYMADYLNMSSGEIKGFVHLRTQENIIPFTTKG